MTRKISPEGIEVIKRFEAFVPFAYDDFDPPKNRRRIVGGDEVRGTLTIGYGHTAGVKPGDRMTEEKASALLLADLAEAEAAVVRLVKVPLNDNQFAALVSFVFNVGQGDFAKSTLLKKLNAGGYASVPAELQRYVFSKGKRLDGLANRRAAEAGLWAKGGYVSSNTKEAAPAKPPVVTVDNAIKVCTPLSTLLAAFTSGTAQVILALGVVALAAWGFYRWNKGRQEAAQ